MGDSQITSDESVRCRSKIIRLLLLFSITSFSVVPVVTLAELTEEQQLAAIAMSATAKYSDRRSAVSQIMDPKLLADIAVGTYEDAQWISERALNRIDDPEVLEDLVTGAYQAPAGIRRLAVGQLHDRARLERLFYAMDDSEVHLGSTILSRFEEPEDLARLAATHTSEFWRSAVLSSIDELKLAQRIESVKGLRDQEQLLQIAYSDEDDGVRAAAASGIKDPTVMAKMVLDFAGKRTAISFNTIERLRDEPQLLADIALQARTSQIRSHALHWLYDDDWLLHVLVNTENAGDVEDRILRRLDRDDHRWEVASTAKPYELRIAALELVDEPRRLGMAAVSDSHFKVRVSALNRINDEILLARAALDGEHRWEKYIATSRSNDRDLLKSIPRRSDGQSIIAELKLALLESGASPSDFLLVINEREQVYTGPGGVAVLHGESIAFSFRVGGRSPEFEKAFDTIFPWQTTIENTRDASGKPSLQRIQEIIAAEIDRQAVIGLLSKYLQASFDEETRNKFARSASTDMLRAASISE